MKSPRRLAGVAVGLAAIAGLVLMALERGGHLAGANGGELLPPPPGPPPKWERPRFTARARERRHMVRAQIERRGVDDAGVLDAVAQVPRHEFVPPSLRRQAYADRPMPIGHGQTISQPYIVAYMTQTLGLRAGHKVLEIGTGSGYQAAVLSEITPHVYSIEIIGALAKTAKARLERLGYKTVRTKLADGYYGWPDAAPFDAIIVTCAAGSIPPPLVQQLKPGGRMCIPVGPPGHFQRLVLVSREPKGRVRTRSLMGVAFVPLTRTVR